MKIEKSCLFPPDVVYRKRISREIPTVRTSGACLDSRAINRRQLGALQCGWRRLYGTVPFRSVPGRWRLGGQDYPAEWAVTEVREGESRPFPLGVWQHVALVVGDPPAHLYHNGLEVASQPVAGILPQPRVASLGIGCKTNSAGTDVELGKPCFWLGRIDELALFNRALSVAEIQRLSAAVGHK